MTKEETFKQYEEKCLKGLHPFKEIYGFDPLSIEIVDNIKWCPICGAYVIDKELDGRLVTKGTIQPPWLAYFKNKE